MNRMDLIKELRHFRDNDEQMSSKDCVALDKAVDVRTRSLRR